MESIKNYKQKHKRILSYIMLISLFCITILTLFLMTSCNNTFYEKSVTFYVYTPFGKQTVNVNGTFYDDQKNVQIKGNFDFDSINDDNKESKFYLCRDAFTLGIEYQDYVELSYAYYNMDWNHIDYDANRDSFEKWANFVNNQILFLRCEYYWGDFCYAALGGLEHYGEAFKFEGRTSLSTKSYEMLCEISSSISDSEVFNDSIRTIENGREITLFIAESVGIYSKEDIIRFSSQYQTLINRAESIIGENYKDLNKLTESIYKIVVYLSDDSDDKLIHYTLPPVYTNDKYRFYGYFSKIGGKGHKHVDETANWIYDPDKNMVLYPYYIPASVHVDFFNSDNKLVVLDENTTNNMPCLPQIDKIKGWYIAGTNIKIADSNGVYRPGYELITNEDYLTAILEENENFVLKLECRYE